MYITKNEKVCLKMCKKLFISLAITLVFLLSGCAASNTNKFADMALWTMSEGASDTELDEEPEGLIKVPEAFATYQITTFDKDICIFSLTNDEKGFFKEIFDAYPVYTPSYVSYEDVVKAFNYFVNDLSNGRPYVIVAEKYSADIAIRLYLENVVSKECGKRLVSMYALMPVSEYKDVPFLPLEPVEKSQTDEEENPIYTLKFSKYEKYLASGEGENGRIVIHDAGYEEGENIDPETEIKYPYATDIFTNMRRRNNNYHLLAGLSSPNKIKSMESISMRNAMVLEDEFIRMADGVYDDMLEADYWIDKLKEPDKVLMTKESIDAWNKMVIDMTGKDGINYYHFYDGVNTTLTKEELESAVNELGFTSAQLYQSNGVRITPEIIEEFERNKNIDGIKNSNSVKYGVIVRRTDVRILPTDMLASTEANNDMYCEWQNSSATINEPVIVIHKSADNNWYYVYTRYCGGWVKAEDIAMFNNYKSWKEAQSCENFVIITEDKTTIDINTKEPAVSALELFMGDKFEVIPKDELKMNEEDRVGYDCYAALIPTRNQYGKVEYIPTYISASKAHLGYLDYTQRNVLAQAFKMDGDRYGWGGMYKERDCSHVVEDIYRCFGFMFSRGPALANTSIDTLYVRGLSDEDKINMLKKIKPGSFLYFPGHIMFYVGMDDDTPYIISYTGSFFIDGEKIKVHGDFVSPLSLVRGNGRSWLDSLEKIKIMPEYQ